VNEFGETLQRLIENRGLVGYEDLARLLQEAGCSAPAREIAACMEGARWVDEHLPGCLARVLELEAEEMGELARVVAYGQAGTTKCSS
jgi:hypothetical protein